MDLHSQLGSSCSSSSDTAAGRSCHFPNTLVHGAAGTLAAREFRHERIFLSAFIYQDSGPGDHYFPAWVGRRFLWSERVREVCSGGGCSGTSILQWLWNIPFVASGGSPSFRMADRTSANNSLGSMDHQCLQFD